MRLPTRLKTRLDTRLPVRMGTKIETRWFRRNEGTTDYAILPRVDMDDNSTVQITVLIDDLDNPHALIGYSSFYIGQLAIFITTDGFLLLHSDRGVQLISTFTINIGELTTLEIIRLGSTVTLTNISTGESDVFTGYSTDSMGFDVLYAFQDGLILRGILSDIKVWSGTTLINYLKMDDNGDTLFDSVGAKDATLVNSYTNDWGKFTDKFILWKGENLTVPPWDSHNQILEVV